MKYKYSKMSLDELQTLIKQGVNLQEILTGLNPNSLMYSLMLLETA